MWVRGQSIYLLRTVRGYRAVIDENRFHYHDPFSATPPSCTVGAGSSSFCVPCVRIDRSIDELGINHHGPPFLGKPLRPSTNMCWVSDAKYR